MAKPRIPWNAAKEARARNILTEKSPYGVDGGQLIGRDPRQIIPRELIEAGLEAAPLIDVIRAKCLDCCSEQADEVRKCAAVRCPNWPYRMGKNPFNVRDLTPEQRQKKADQMRAMRAARK